MLFSFFSFQAMSQVEQVTENQAGISRRLQLEIDNTKDPKLGYVPKAKLVDAYKDKSKKIKDKKASMAAIGAQTGVEPTAAAISAAGGFTWTERGPFSDAVGPSNGNTRAGNGKTSGRVRAVFEDADGTTIWVGGY